MTPGKTNKDYEYEDDDDAVDDLSNSNDLSNEFLFDDEDEEYDPLDPYEDIKQKNKKKDKRIVEENRRRLEEYEKQTDPEGWAKKQAEKEKQSNREQRRELEARVMYLRRSGASHSDIARALKISEKSVNRAIRNVVRRLEKRAADDVLTLRHMELERLDELQRALWKQAKDGDPGAIKLILQIMERRSKYIGLDAKEEKSKDSGTFVIKWDSSGLQPPPNWSEQRALPAYSGYGLDQPAEIIDVAFSTSSDTDSLDSESEEIETDAENDAEAE